MIKLQTPVTLPASRVVLDHGDGIVSIGSCFSQHIGEQLARLGHRICINPFGVQYNPLSILKALERLLAGDRMEEEELFYHDGLWHSWLYHGHYSYSTMERSLEVMNRSLEQARERLFSAKVLFLTWGTSYVYRLKETGHVVSNCHRVAEGHFVRELVSVADLVGAWRAFLPQLWEHLPDLQIVTTVSPIRHLRDGAHGNQLSKATLMLFGEQLLCNYPERISYFPAYEIVLDELRDYRYYADDLVHPSSLAQRIVGERFVDWCSSAKAKELYPTIRALGARLQHRPRIDVPEYAEKMHRELRQDLTHFSNLHPEVDWSIYGAAH